MTQEIDPNLVKTLQSCCSEIIYQRDEIVIHEGHIPRVGFILIEGKIEIIMSKTKKEVLPMKAIGVRELVSKRPFKYTVKIYPNTKVLSLDRSTLLMLASNDDEKVRDFANAFLLSA